MARVEFLGLGGWVLFFFHSSTISFSFFSSSLVGSVMPAGFTVLPVRNMKSACFSFPLLGRNLTTPYSFSARKVPTS